MPDFIIEHKVSGLTMSATLAINEMSNGLIKQGRKVYKLGLGQSPFPVPASVVQALRDNADCKDYLPVRGLPSLRRAVAAFYKKTQGLDYNEGNILIGPGSKELMFQLQMVCDSDLVLPSPSWVSYVPQAQILGRSVRYVDTKRENGWRLMPEDLDRFCTQNGNRRRILLLNYPNNPSGTSYTADMLKALASVADKHGIIIMSDEIYGETDHDGGHVSIARFYGEGTIISSGLSKWCGAGGWRLGTFAVPDSLSKISDAMAATASETFTSVCAPVQYAAVKAFELGPDIVKYLEDSRKVLKMLGGKLENILNDAGIYTAHVTGGFYMFPDFGKYAEQFRRVGINTSADMCRRLLKDTGVAMLPGSCFGRPDGEFTARMAYVDFDGGAALGAVNSGLGDDDFLAEYCPECVAAVKLTAEWTKNFIS